MEPVATTEIARQKIACVSLATYSFLNPFPVIPGIITLDIDITYLLHLLEKALPTPLIVSFF